MAPTPLEVSQVTESKTSSLSSSMLAVGYSRLLVTRKQRSCPQHTPAASCWRDGSCPSFPLFSPTRSRSQTPTIRVKYVQECGRTPRRTSMVSTSRADPECTECTLTSSRTVTFDKSSHGQLAAVIYEWSDVQYLGKTTSYVDDLPVSFGARLTAANIDNSVLNVELAENVHLHNRCAHFPLLRRLPAREIHH